MIYNTQQYKKGFTLIEALVATAILLVAVIGPMSFMGDSLSKIYVYRDQIIASNLATEGIEGVRQIRDSNLNSRWSTGTTNDGYNPVTATPSSWLEGITQNSSCVFGADCVLEVTPSPILSSCQGACISGKIYRTPAGIFTHISTGNTMTQFSRFIQVTSVNSNEIKVTSTVAWKTSGGTTKIVTLTENLFGINN